METQASRKALSWWVTSLYVVISAVLATTFLTTLSPKVTYGAALPEAAKCAPFGIAVSADWWLKTPEEVAHSYALARGIGACGVRLGVMWNEIEQSPGHYNWDVMDSMVQGALDAGIEPMLMLYAPPEWAHSDGGFPAQPASGSLSGSSLSSLPGSSLSSLPGSSLSSLLGSSESAGETLTYDSNFESATRHFGEFAAQVAHRYGNHVTGYEVWNEPNVARFFSPPDIDAYAKILEAVYPRIHEADPTSTVISAGMAPAPDAGGSISPVSFIRGLYDRGAQQYFDAVGMHPYTWREAPQDRHQFLDVDEVEQIMAAHGDGNKKMWVTEYGAPTGGLGGMTQAEQSEMIHWAIGEAERNPKIEKFYLYALQDYPLGLLDPEAHFGVYTTEGQAKVAANSLRAELR